MPKTLGRSHRPASARQVAPQENRGSPASRGYDYIWTKLSKRLRRQIGICERCDRLGRVRTCDVIDHKLPIAEGGERLERKNLWGLCKACHDGWKAELEGYARRTGQIEKLPIWCDEPGELPAKFREVRA